MKILGDFKTGLLGGGHTDWAQQYKSQHYISAEGFTRICHTWHILGKDFRLPSVYSAAHFAMPMGDVQH